MDTAKQLYRYWFRFGSPVTFGVFRAVMCGLIFINLLMVGVFFTDFFGQKGYVPAEIGARWLETRTALNSDSSIHINRVNLLFGVTDDRVIFAFYWATAGFALLSALGLFSRVSTIALAIGIVSLHHRNAPLLHGGDTWMRLAAIYLAVGPSGSAFSLDRWIALRRGTAPAVPPLMSMWPQRLLQYNLALLYFTTVWAKWFGGLWKEGTATWYPARLHEFDRFPVPDFVNQFPMVKVTTWGTLLVEFALATLVWFKPLRKWVLLSGVALHLYIEYSMNIPLFAFLMMSTYIVYYEGEETAAWWDRLKSRFARTS